MPRKLVSLDEVLEQRPVNRKRVNALRDSMLQESRAYRLAELRQRAELTQEQLAQVLGIDQSGVSRIERGKFSRTEIATIAAFVEALGGSLEITVRIGGSSFRLIEADAEPSR